MHIVLSWFCCRPKLTQLNLYVAPKNLSEPDMCNMLKSLK